MVMDLKHFDGSLRPIDREGESQADPRVDRAADRSTRAGKWEKSRFMGVELFNKTLGVIGLGKIGTFKHLPPTLLAQWHFPDVVPNLKPYVGAGINYMLFFGGDDHNGFQVDLDNGFGYVLQAGVDYKLSPTLGLFVDVKKLFLKTTASGSLPALGGARIGVELVGIVSIDRGSLFGKHEPFRLVEIRAADSVELAEGQHLRVIRIRRPCRVEKESVLDRAAVLRCLQHACLQIPII